MGLNIGDKGQAVRVLQRRLNARGAGLVVDGWFGRKTQMALKSFQRLAGLIADGIAGPKTQDALIGATQPNTLSQRDLISAAHKLGVKLAALLAITEVESNFHGFLGSGRTPVVLYERHIMYRRLEANGLNAQAVAEAHPRLVSRDPGGYVGGAGELVRLRSAERIDRASAIEATSWGLFQILGEHWSRLGYDSADDYARQMATSEADQLDAFVRFVDADAALHKSLVAHDWPAFARGYNGPDYAINDYDSRLTAAYRRHADTSRAQVAA